MPRKKEPSAPPRKRPIERYEHTDKKRINNPPVGLVTPETDPVAPSHKIYDYVDPIPSRLARNLKAEIDPDLIQAYRGTVSLPFEPGDFKRSREGD